MSTPPTIQELGRRWFEEVWGQRNDALIPQLLARDYHGFLEGQQTESSYDDIVNFRRDFLAAVPDMQVTVHRVIGEGDEAFVHWAATGTHTGQGMGLAPSGQRLSFEGVTWLKAKDGQFITSRDFWNVTGLVNQMSTPLA